MRADTEQWYRQYAFAVHARCAALLGSHAEAEDALHEVFVRAHRALAWKAPEHPLRWLYRVADNHCFDLLKRRKWTARPTEASRALREHASTPDERALESQRFLTQVLVSCKREVRESAVLYYVDELTQDEIAEVLKCSRKTVKERLARFHEVASRMSGDPVPEAK